MLVWWGLTLRNSIHCVFRYKTAFKRTNRQVFVDFCWMLRLGFGRSISPVLYYPYRLYRATERSGFEDYLPSWEMGIICRMISRKRKCDVAYLDNKRRFAEFCRTFNLPHPPTLFSEDIDGDAPRFPGNSLFVKPAKSFGGKGCLKIGYSAGKGRWILDAEYFDERMLCDKLKAMYPQQPHIIQSLIRPHAEIEDLGRGALPTLRILSCIKPDGNMALLRGTFRMALRDPDVDNLTLGGIASPIDLETGMLGKAISLSNGEAYDDHPVTGARIQGRRLPAWEAVLSLLKSAQKNALDFTFCGWDLAITTEGPVLVECNVWPEVEVSQIPHGVGLLRDPVVVESLLKELSGGQNPFSDINTDGDPSG